MLAHTPTHTRVNTQTLKTRIYAPVSTYAHAWNIIFQEELQEATSERKTGTSLRDEVPEIMEEIEDENIEKRDIYGDNGTVVVNEGDNEDEEMNYALEHIDLGREDLVELVNDAMTV